MKGYFSDIGVHHFYDYKHEDVVKQIQSEHHSSFNCLIDAVGSAEYTQKLLALLPGRGKVGVYGLKQVEDYKISPLSHKGSITFATTVMIPRRCMNKLLHPCYVINYVLPIGTRLKVFL